MEIFDDKIFENIDFTVKLLPKGEYESCSFINCNLSNLDVSHYTFIDTNFVGCNLSLLKLNNTILRTDELILQANEIMNQLIPKNNIKIVL